MIVWEEIVNRYVMSIFLEEALSVFGKGGPGQSCFGEGNRSHVSRIGIYPHLIHPLAFNMGKSKRDRREYRNHHFILFVFSPEKE